MWQEIAIIVIGALVVIYTGYKIFRIIKAPTKHSFCAGCTASCTLKDQYDLSKNNKKKKIIKKTP